MLGFSVSQILPIALIDRGVMFLVLAGFYLGLLILVASLIIWPLYVAYAMLIVLILIIITAIQMTPSSGQALAVAIGLPLVGLIFAAGLIKGTAIKVRAKL